MLLLSLYLLGILTGALAILIGWCVKTGAQRYQSDRQWQLAFEVAELERSRSWQHDQESDDQHAAWEQAATV